jgi:probable F420-dependent oxidoreductase
MRLGITMFATDRAMPPHLLARDAEDRGFASVYLPEHTHIPTARTTPAPTGADTLPEEYARTPDPLVALAAAAAVTERIALGTGVCLLAQREPIVTAKAIATLDRISGGRFVLGVGYGWNVEEAADHGTAWSERRELVRDRMALMRALWAEEPTAHQGPYASVRASVAYPKPVVRTRPSGDPLTGPRTLIGGAAGPRLFAHIAAYADGWLPIGGGGLTEALPELRRVWAEAGRDPAALEVVPYAVRPSPGKLAHYAGLGIEEVVVQLPSGDETETLHALDAYAQYL